MSWLRRGTLTALCRVRSIATAKKGLHEQLSILPSSHGSVERELARQWSQPSLDTSTGAWSLPQLQLRPHSLSLRGVHGTSVAWSNDAAALSDRSTPPDNANSAHSYRGRVGSSLSRKKVRCSADDMIKHQNCARHFVFQTERRPWPQYAVF